MDTISQDNNESSFSWLPVLALIVGVIAGVLAGVALAKVTNIDKTLAEQSAIAARIDDLEGKMRDTATSAETANKNITKVIGDTQKGFNTMGDLFGKLSAKVDELETKAITPPPVVSSSSSGSSSAPAVAGPNEYLVKSGDTGIKIARTLGVSWTDLQAVNPGVNWNRLAIGQPIKVPQK
ncbi:LysM peptidoglycan-binding domain-containing protein [Actomonas aquatica]|uniref:LysM peptidoglycan-binding domain-containing protein n=1 Tax=Actomonas aquatica TaxID=2866162 RepID=A0ABZ1CEU5_9BACT|nr:LysM peptidoglycan-binding domain-containing protein [Opitutus sp. WL0086]WRQ89753.1 LysM peptidoglycan-binding domain-containing protein [Opitutus sp. WL0086]